MTEWNARAYHEQSSLQKALADENLAKLALKGDERVLDLGCGDGKITAEIAAHLPRGSVLGVDPSHDMIAFASRNYSQANLRFEVGDARTLPYRNEFDLVISFNALHWVREQDAALRSIRAGLKPHGRTHIQFVPDTGRPSLEDVIEQTRRQAPWNAHFADFEKPFAHFTPEQYRALAEQNGLRVIRIETTEHAWDFHTPTAFADFCRATFVEWTRRLPEEKRSDFIEDVLERYRAVAAWTKEEENTFKFAQLEVVLTPA